MEKQIKLNLDCFWFSRFAATAPVCADSYYYSVQGKQSQARRKEAYQSFVEAQTGALFCTDVAARGLDIPQVDWIVQYDPPSDPKVCITSKVTI